MIIPGENFHPEEGEGGAFIDHHLKSHKKEFKATIITYEEQRQKLPKVSSALTMKLVVPNLFLLGLSSVMGATITFDTPNEALCLLDFAEFQAGDWVSDVGCGVTVTAGADSNAGCFGPDGTPDGDQPMVFDSSNPTGGDGDLGSPNERCGGPGEGRGGRPGKDGENCEPLGNLLIISDDCSTTDPNDLSSDPGFITFTLDITFGLGSVGILDFNEGATLVAKDEMGAEIKTVEIPPDGDNSFWEAVFDIPYGVKELTISGDKFGGVAYVELLTTRGVVSYTDFADTELRAADPGSFRGDDTDIEVDRSDGNDRGLWGKTSAALVKAPSLALPAGATLINARLVFYTNDGSSNTISAYRIEESWSESSTWNDLVPLQVNSATSFTIVAPVDEENVSVNVKDDVEFWLDSNNMNEGWVLTNNGFDGWEFDSAETRRGPRLVVRYSDSSGDVHVDTYTDLIDTMVWKLNPNSAYGDLTDIAVDRSHAASETRALVKAETIEIPAGTVLATARLSFYTNDPSTGNVDAFRMEEAWDEASTWDSFVPGPMAAATRSFRIAAPVDETVVTRDVTDDVAFWLDGHPNYGWLLTNDSTNGWDFDSSETPNGPKLRLVYLGSPSPP